MKIFVFCQIGMFYCRHNSFCITLYVFVWSSSVKFKMALVRIIIAVETAPPPPIKASKVFR